MDDTQQLDLDVVFFDIKDTLGVIDRPGHLVAYKPSTRRLLETMRDTVGVRIGVITNLPKNVSSDQGRALLEDAGLTEYLDPDGIVINHDVGIDKPRAEIYRRAAEQMGAAVKRCLFVGENLIEVLAAQAAGMRATLKSCPPAGI